MDGRTKVLAKYLAPPGRLADLLAIAGDKSDGIKGADGYGPVNAAKVDAATIQVILLLSHQLEFSGFTGR
ncbi:unnamed protein product, partial [Sphacelaria rigidula]